MYIFFLAHNLGSNPLENCVQKEITFSINFFKSFLSDSIDMHKENDCFVPSAFID